jgi:Integrase zinc binding domain
MLNWSKKQMADQFCGPIMRYLRYNELPTDMPSAQCIMNKSRHYVVVHQQLHRVTLFNDDIVKEKRLVVPECHRKKTLKYFHCTSSGTHMGMMRTLRRIQSIYWWSNMWNDVQALVEACGVCQDLRTNLKPYSPMPCIAVGGSSVKVLAADAQVRKMKKTNYEDRSSNVFYEPGQLVMYANRRRPYGVRGKLKGRWFGPFVIVNRTSAVMYTIRANHSEASERNVHVDQLRPFYTRETHGFRADSCHHVAEIRCQAQPALIKLPMTRRS